MLRALAAVNGSSAPDRLTSPPAAPAPAMTNGTQAFGLQNSLAAASSGESARSHNSMAAASGGIFGVSPAPMHTAPMYMGSGLTHGLPGSGYVGSGAGTGDMSADHRTAAAVRGMDSQMRRPHSASAAGGEPGASSDSYAWGTSAGQLAQRYQPQPQPQHLPMQGLEGTSPDISLSASLAKLGIFAKDDIATVQQNKSSVPGGRPAVIHYLSGACYGRALSL